MLQIKLSLTSLRLLHLLEALVLTPGPCQALPEQFVSADGGQAAAELCVRRLL